MTWTTSLTILLAAESICITMITFLVISKQKPNNISQNKMSDQLFSSPVAKKSRPGSSNDTAKKKKICQICGDFSLGFNFGAISCESCKAFFRRNATKLKVLVIIYSAHFYFILKSEF